MRVLERVGLGTALAATVTGVVLVSACTTQVDGKAEVSQPELSAYRSEVSASSAAASSSKAAAIARVTLNACDQMRAANSSSVKSFNAYITASNNHAPDENTKATEAVTTLRTNAKELDRKITTDVLAEVATALKAYRDDTNVLADTLERRAGTDELNGVIDKFNTTKDHAIEVCRPHSK
ncbi:hypothetical protein ACWEVD_26800 [Nocardia thailandica]|uniref:Lipoprotein n=1 Tax=Nocardia thailandica TaxID=257275 RepID=A0ABW6PSY8_9NOCA|nr:hypothetical protein [Nocardia thailandica]